MLWSLWRKKLASTSNCSTRCASTCWLTSAAVDAVASISWAATQLTTRSSLRGIMSSCTGALREPGLPLLVVEWGCRAFALGACGVSQVTDAYESREVKTYRTLAYPAAIFRCRPKIRPLRGLARCSLRRPGWKPDLDEAISTAGVLD